MSDEQPEYNSPIAWLACDKNYQQTTLASG